MDKGMDKAVGVRKACEVAGVPMERTAAIGDSENDERMLRECGWGIAIGNAMEKSKAAASFVSRASNGAGVVEGLVWLRLIEG